MLFNSVASNSSCDLRAFKIVQMGLKAVSSKAFSASDLLGISTGKTIVPRVLSLDFLIARPTAWMMSTWLERGSINATASRAGTSIPSVRQRAFDRSECWFGISALSLSKSIRRSDEFIAPVMVSAQNVPEGLWSSGIHSTIFGKSWANACAVLIRPWNEMVFLRS